MAELLKHLPDGVTVTFHRVVAVSARPRRDGRFDVDLEGGSTLTTGSVVLALGHVESGLNPEQRALQQAATG